ncbi:MAG: HlyD family secretion protein, partial [Hyphomicrobiaceae bacterium]
AGANDEVRVGDPLAVLKQEEAVARLSAARSEVEVRIAERDEEKETDEAMLAWRKALDELSDAERALHEARIKFDRLYIGRRKANASNGEVANARKAIAAAKSLIEQRRDAVREAASNEELPPPSRLDSGLEIARSDLKLAEIAFDRTTVRATSDGKVLQFDARVGETVSPSSNTPVAIVGDLSNLKVTAEVEERDIAKIRVDQAAVVKSNAFGDEEFAGKVTRIASRVATPGLGLRGRNELRDVEVLEVEISLEGAPPLLPGMRVDVFFKAKGATKAAAKH